MATSVRAGAETPRKPLGAVFLERVPVDPCRRNWQAGFAGSGTNHGRNGMVAAWNAVFPLASRVDPL
jgi:hypothetical protein